MTDAAAPSSRRTLDPGQVILLLACAGLTALGIRYARDYHFNVVDDAYISFQYAKNWALGSGLTFNVGERVEGYTNFLWVALLTPFIWISRALSLDFTTLAIGLNLALAVVNVLLSAQLARELLGGRWLPPAIAVLLLVLDDAYRVYAISGLENSLLSTCLLLALWAFVRGRQALLGLALAAAAMTRPDALLFGGVCGIVCVLAWIPGAKELVPGAPLEKPRLALQALGVFGLVFGVYFAARWAYYGDIVPNTFHVKAGKNMDAWARGWQYTRGFLAQRLYLPAVALAAPFFLRRAWTVWLGLYVLLHGLYVTYVGGDFYQGYRFYVSLLPLVALLLGAIADDVATRLAGKPGLRTAALAGAVVLAAAFTWRTYLDGPYRGEIERWGAVVDNNVRYQKWLGTRFPPGTSMVVGDIGASGFFADLRVIDVYGIVDPVVAKQEPANFGRGKPGHEKIAPASYLMSKEPDLVKWGYVHGDLRRRGYYIFTEFPPDLDVDGLWVKDDLPRRGDLLGTALSLDDAEGWEASGDATQFLAARGPRRGQLAITGATGGFVNTYTERGDAATGTLLSPEFELTGSHLVLSVGGGRDEARLKVALLVDGQEVHTATGHGAEVLGRRLWDVGAWRGQIARLAITDEATGGWGHLLVDEVQSWELRPDVSAAR